MFDGSRRAIVHNDSHAPVRQCSNLGHELSHGLLAHPPTPAIDDTGCRIWNQDIEDEATWLSGCLLVTESAALAIAGGRWTTEEAAARFGVSTAMINYRLNATGARDARLHEPRPVRSVKSDEARLNTLASRPVLFAMDAIAGSGVSNGRSVWRRLRAQSQRPGAG